MATQMRLHDTQAIREKIERWLGDQSDLILQSNCEYLDMDNIESLDPVKYNFKVIQINIRSLLGKQGRLKLLLYSLRTLKFVPDVILLCETHLNTKTER